MEGHHHVGHLLGAVEPHQALATPLDGAPRLLRLEGQIDQPVVNLLGATRWPGSTDRAFSQSLAAVSRRRVVV